ncbi:MAG: sulfurtransferase [Burkholderiaceae bacterium]|nr:sulfurtransferase [Burkholderiaceae bacterium]
MPYANPHYLVEPQWLAAHLDDPNLRIIDVSGCLTSKLENTARQRVYERGHIPGAIFLDVASAHGEFSDPGSALPWMWPSQPQFEALMARLGIGNDSRVILYASTQRQGIDNGPMWCTRAWWVMHHFGVDCAVLNGSWETWRAEGLPVSTVAAAHAPARFVAAPHWRRALADRHDVLAAIRMPKGSTCVVDALSERSFEGRERFTYGPRKGHISGAINLPMRDLVDLDTGVFVGADMMRERFERDGVLSSEKVITYCGGAIAATVDAFALALLGYTEVSVYDGSLFEWAADPALPMTDPSGAPRTGDDPLGP